MIAMKRMMRKGMRFQDALLRRRTKLFAEKENVMTILDMVRAERLPNGKRGPSGERPRESTPMAILGARQIDVEVPPLPAVTEWSWKPKVRSIAKLNAASALALYTKRLTNMGQVDGGEGQ